MINICTSNNREIIEATYKKQRVLIYLFSATLALLVAVALIIPSILLLNIRISAISHGISTARVKPVSKDADILVASVKEINTRVKSLSEAKVSAPFGELVDKILAHKTVGISILHIDRSNAGGINLKGRATTRTILLDFIKSIKGDPYFSEVTSPISNLISSTDISFSINMKPVENAVQQ